LRESTTRREPEEEIRGGREKEKEGGSGREEGGVETRW